MTHQSRPQKRKKPSCSDSSQAIARKSAKKEFNLMTYIVEKIVDTRITRNQLQYFVKWKGYPESQNTWEPEKHLVPSCNVLIERFERNQQRRKEEDPFPYPIGSRKSLPTLVDLTPVKISGAYRNGNAISFWITLANGEVDLVPAAEVKALYPGMLIEFYENNIMWKKDGVLTKPIKPFRTPKC